MNRDAPEFAPAAGQARAQQQVPAQQAQARALLK
jgi:hypothetical protein